MNKDSRGMSVKEQKATRLHVEIKIESDKERNMHEQSEH